MTEAAQRASDVRVIPEWDLSDRMTKSLNHIGMSSAEMAEIMGVSVGTISRWINGKNKPGRPVLMVWADLTGVELDWLENGERACRDSNPKPSVLVLVGSERQKSVRPVLTPKLGTPGHRTRHLASVS